MSLLCRDPEMPRLKGYRFPREQVGNTQAGSYLGDDDIIRYEDVYARS